jgi:hypothetical protein
MVFEAPELPVSSTERRYAPRARSDLAVHVGTTPLLADARTLDVSMGGLLIARDRPLLVADTDMLLDVDLALPGDPAPIHAIARTVWWWGPYQALRFIKMAETDRLRLAEHIDRVSIHRPSA